MCRKFGQFITLQDNRLWKLVEWLYAFSRGSGPDSPHQLFRQLPNYFPWNKMAEVGIHFCWTLKKTNKQTKKPDEAWVKHKPFCWCFQLPADERIRSNYICSWYEPQMLEGLILHYRYNMSRTIRQWKTTTGQNSQTWPKE